MIKFPSKCPSCSSPLKIKVLECPSCNLRIEGDFEIPSFLNLDEKDMEMLFLFLKTRGNLSEVSKILGISYPTVRIRFEEFLRKIGIEPSFPKEKIFEILDLLEKGEISVSEAERRIRELK